jgi:hypothetical protein
MGEKSHSTTTSHCSDGVGKKLFHLFVFTVTTPNEYGTTRDGEKKKGKSYKKLLRVSSEREGMFTGVNLPAFLASRSKKYSYQ